MNFIDQALATLNTLSADDFLQAMANIYHEPAVWEKLKQYPKFVQDTIFIIDYDTELQMEGFSGFFSDSTKEHYEETYHALLHCGAFEEAEILKNAKEIDPESDTADEEYKALEEQTALHKDYPAFWIFVKDYIEREKTAMAKSNEM